MNMIINPSTRKNKKFQAIFSDGTIIHFGGRKKDGTPYEDFTTHRDEKRKERYIKRHAHEDWNDPKSAATLSRYILWNLPTVIQSLADYKKRFNLK